MHPITSYLYIFLLLFNYLFVCLLDYSRDPDQDTRVEDGWIDICLIITVMYIILHRCVHDACVRFLFENVHIYYKQTYKPRIMWKKLKRYVFKNIMPMHYRKITVHIKQCLLRQTSHLHSGSGEFHRNVLCWNMYLLHSIYNSDTFLWYVSESHGGLRKYLFRFYI